MRSFNSVKIWRHGFLLRSRKKLCTFKMPAKRVRFREISSNFAIVVIVLSCTFHSHALGWYAFKAKNSTISAQSRTTRVYRYVAVWHISTYLQADASSCIVQCAFSLKGPLDEQKSFAVEWCSWQLSKGFTAAVVVALHYWLATWACLVRFMDSCRCMKKQVVISLPLTYSINQFTLKTRLMIVFYVMVYVKAPPCFVYIT